MSMKLSLSIRGYSLCESLIITEQPEPDPSLRQEAEENTVLPTLQHGLRPRTLLRMHGSTQCLPLPFSSLSGRRCTREGAILFIGISLLGLL